MSQGKLEIYREGARTVVELSQDRFLIGRGKGNDLALGGADVSRHHAEIVRVGEGYVLRDLGSRFGTSVNDKPVTECVLRHGDRLRFGASDPAEIHFLLAGPVRKEPSTQTTQPAVGPVADLHQVTALLEGLRALGSGRVLEKVLAIVLDSALAVTGAERGFVMLANHEGVLEFRLARARGGQPLVCDGLATSRKIPDEVFATGRPKVTNDIAADSGEIHDETRALGIGAVICAPLKLVSMEMETGPEQGLEEDFTGTEEPRVIGVLCLDSQTSTAAVSKTTLSVLEALAEEAALAIENARLYREAAEKAILEKEMESVQQMQQELLPPRLHVTEAIQIAGVTKPCTRVGGDLFDYHELPGERLGIVLADVTGHGASAALLAAKVQGILASLAPRHESAADTVQQLNTALVRRAVPRKFASLAYVVISNEGRLVSCNAGQNPPLLLHTDGRVDRLEKGGLILGQFEWARFEEQQCDLEPGATLVMYSDGLTDAADSSGEPFGEERLIECLRGSQSLTPDAIAERLLAAAYEHARGHVQEDDITVVAARYAGRHLWFLCRVPAYESGLLLEAEEERFLAHREQCPACREAHDLFEAMETPRGEEAGEGTHIPASLLARWPRRDELLSGVEEEMVFAHLQRCRECREDLALLGYRWEGGAEPGPRLALEPATTMELGPPAGRRLQRRPPPAPGREVGRELERGLQQVFRRRLNGLEVAGATAPARTRGGDFVSCSQLADGRLSLALGDVSGVGDQAALLSAMVRGVYASQSEFWRSPAITLARMNSVLATARDSTRLIMFVHAVLSPDGRLIAANAGHNPPVILRHDGSLQLLEKGGFPLGVFEDVSYEEEITVLEPGDALVIASDGVLEALRTGEEPPGGDEFARLFQDARLGARDFVAELLWRVQMPEREDAVPDDLTVVAVSATGRDSEGGR